MKRVLILACHWDDEVLGCGGLLHSLSKREDVETYVAIVASERKTNGTYDDVLTNNLFNQHMKVKEILGIKEYYFGRCPDEELHDYFDHVRHFVETLRDKIRPDEIYVQSPTDINQDHETLFKAAKIAFRLQRINKPFKLYTYEVLSSSEQGYAPFDPNTFLELQWEDMDAKGRAMKCYTSEINDARCYEAVQIQARYRGIQAGYLFAEAYKLIQQKGDLQ